MDEYDEDVKALTAHRKKLSDDLTACREWFAQLQRAIIDVEAKLDYIEHLRRRRENEGTDVTEKKAESEPVEGEPVDT